MANAFSHQSYLSESNIKGGKNDHRRLDGLGAVITRLIFTHLSFEGYYQESGPLSNFVQAVLSRGLLTNIINRYGLIEFVITGKGQDKKYLSSESILNPIIALVYLENGYQKVYDFFARDFMQSANDVLENPVTDWKTAIQEWSQKSKISPKYEIICEKGPDHDKYFEAKVVIESRSAKGLGKTKKAAEIDAAMKFHESFIPRNHWCSPFKGIPKKEYLFPKIFLPDNRTKHIKSLIETFPADLNLINQCLIHKSFVFENTTYLGSDNRSLATLGSYVLTFLYSDFLFQNYFDLRIDPNILKAYLTSEKFCSTLFDRIIPSKLLLMGRGQTKEGLSDSIKNECLKAFFGAVFLTNLDKGKLNPFHGTERFIQKYIVNECKEFEIDEFDPKSQLQELVTRLNIEIFFTKDLGEETHIPEHSASVTIVTSKGAKYRWSGTRRTVQEASNDAARLSLKKIKGALNLLSDMPIGIRKKFKPLILDYFDALVSKRIKTSSKAWELIELGGGLGLRPLLNSKFVEGRSNLIQSTGVLRLIGINLEDYINDILVKIDSSFKLVNYSLRNINNYIIDLADWLVKVTPATQKMNFDPFLNEIVDSIQVFRFLNQEPFSTVDLNEIIADITLVKPKGIDILFQQVQSSPVFGQRPFLTWLLFSILSKLQDCRIDQSQLLRVNMLLDNNYENMSTELYLKFDSTKLTSKTSEILDASLQLSAVCLIEYKQGLDYLHLRFLNLELGDDSLTKTSNQILKLIHTKYLDSIMDLSSLGGILHDLKNGLQVLQRNVARLENDPLQYTLSFVTARDSCLAKALSLQTYFRTYKPNFSHINLLDFSGGLSKEIRKLAHPECKVNFSFNKLLTDEVISDATMLHSIVINIAKNSIESIKGVGQVSIDFSVEHQDELIIIIQDDGCGIQKDKLNKLFRSFSTTKEKTSGTGLGLPTAKRLVDLLEGVIEVKSGVNNGTTVTILIPLKTQYFADGVI